MTGPVFKLKKGPILRWSRGLHAAEAAAATQVGGMLWGDVGAAKTAAVVLGAGMAWELSNKYIVKGPHQYADMWDWLAFVAGTLATGAIRSIL